MKLADTQPTLVELRGITKVYPGVRALGDVSLTLTGGTVTALAGENGAGKSTFIKVLAGAETPDSGTVELDAEALRSDPGAVIDAGVSVIYQELTDVPDMSVLDNVLLGRQAARIGMVRNRTNRRRAHEALGRVGLDDLDLSQPIRTLSLSQRQLVEIARCLARDAKVLVFDEPTSSLHESEVDALLATIASLRDSGLAILYVSHHLDELFRVANRIAVLREGEIVAEAPVGDWTQASLVKAMLAKDLDQAYPWEPRELGEQRLEGSHIIAPGVRDVDISARAGEIVGLIGLAGAGRTELMKSLAGITRRTSGEVRIDGTKLHGGDITAARRSGVVYAPEDRKVEGLVLESSIENNLTIGLYSLVAKGGWISRRRQRTLALDGVDRFGVKLDSLFQLVGRLSGGNQQKVLLARAAAAAPKVALLDDPTRGVDIGAKSSIHAHILNLAKQGTTVFITSSDTEEVLAAADRSYVMRAGRVVANIARADYDREEILRLATAG